MHVFYQKPSTSEIDPSIQAKTKWSYCLFNTIPFLTYLIIYLSLLTQSEFRQSQAAENFSCSRTKQQQLLIA